MSSALAVAAVTEVLKDLLNNGVIDHDLTGAVGGNVTVTALPPDRIPTGDQEADQLNLFLYLVTPNQGWRNVGLPSRDAQGERLSNPLLALDLHYLLSAYGRNEFHAEILLGYAMQILHETPVLTRDAIRKSLAVPAPVNGGILPPALHALSAADLADQVEQIKVTPQALNTEETSKLWTAMQAHYRPTAAYQASVVLIESTHSTRQPLPVRARNLLVVPFHQPAIDTVLPEIITAGSKLTLLGRNLKADLVKVTFGSAFLDPDTLTDQQITITLPAAVLAGVRGVQVVHLLSFGTPSDPHAGFESNVAAFVVRPTVLSASPSGTGVLVKFNPPVGKTQRVVLLLNQTSVPSRAYSFQAPPRNKISDPDTTDTLTIPISGVQPGTYYVRVQVDGAESLLDVDAKNQYTGTPHVTL